METATTRLAKKLLLDPKLVILDLETTGFLVDDSDARIVQITLMNNRGRIIFSSLINPERKIPKEATAAHGITDDDVADAPTLASTIPLIKKFLDNSSLAVYNAGFDVHFLTHRLKELGEADKIFLKNIYCVMEMYQNWSGANKRQPLPNLSGGKKHDSTVDCSNTLLLLKRMAGTATTEENIISLDF